VTGGTFYRSYDGVTFTDQGYPATVSDFRLDKFEVTVGRFRNFVAAWVAGWRPLLGVGKHTHLNDGRGLTAAGGGYEAGWDAAWTIAFATTSAEWATNLACNPDSTTWTPVADANETRPINCINWYEAYAFCIWDGGFLASEAEWNYAAAGGSEQRVYPWGATVPGADATLAVYGCYYAGTGSCSGIQSIAPVGSAPLGNGKYGQADLAGNMWEWNLDVRATYVNTCDDCAKVTTSGGRARRGGSYLHDATYLPASVRFSSDPTERSIRNGARCGRTP
jgi:sulfatase modifying factor 1